MKRNTPSAISFVSAFFLVAVAFTAGAANDLPEGYFRVEWLQSKGSTSIFDTGYVFTNKPLVKTTAMIRTNGDGDVAGTAVAAGGCFIVDYFDQQKKVYYRYSTANSVGMVYTKSVVNRWVDYEWGETVKHDGEVIGTVSSYNFATNKQPFRLFGGRNALSCSMKTVEMYDGDELVRKYIPCIERSTRRVGMYDAVGGTFHQVDATSGPVEPVANADGFLEAKYIESTGAEYVDTGYVFTNAPRVDVSYYIVSFYDSDIMGTTSADEPCFIVDIYPIGGKYYYRYGSASATQIAAGLTSKRWYDCSFGTNVVQDGATLATVPAVSFASNRQSFKLFAGRSYSTVRIRHLRMYDGDVLVRDFEPCYCGSFGEFGFRDKVGGGFFPSLRQPFKRVPFKVRPSKRAEYLESTSSRTQLIDTDVIFTNTPLVKARMKFCQQADRDVAGTFVGAADCFIVDYATGASGGTLYYRYAAAGYTSKGYTGGIGEWRDYEWGPTVRHDGNAILTVTAADGAFASNRRPFTLFGARDNNNSWVAFSSVQMFENGEMVRDLIPAVYKGEAGMYDQVEGFFYFNVGTGEFETGRVFSDATVIMAH